MKVRLEPEAWFVDVSEGSTSVKDLDEFRFRWIIVGDGPLERPTTVVQVARAIVADEALFIVLHPDRLTTAEERHRIVDRLHRHVAAGYACFVIAHGTGWAIVETSTAPHASVAAATAVVQYSWAWDESEAFAITVDETECRVAVEYRGDATYSCAVL